MHENLINDINYLITFFEKYTNNNIKAVLGFDGFVDQILHVVKTRTDANNYIRMNTLKEFGEFICNAAGLSANVEFIPIKNKLGGNGPIMSNALSTYNLNVTYIGAVGENSINPVFNEMSEKSTVLNISNPGLTDAVEFLDGKLMIGKRECLKDINWIRIKEKIGLESLTSIFDEANLVGLENWTMIPYMSEIWDGLINEVLPNLKSKTNKYIFFDLADPENRLKEDIIEALSTIKKFSSKFKVILGLNEKEAYEIGTVLNICKHNQKLSLDILIKSIAEKIGIYCLVVHPVKEAYALCNNTLYHTLGPYEPNPKLTTGAGDNFNAGFCFGQVLGLSAQLSLVLGTATSGYYVRNAQSPNVENLVSFLKAWKKSIS
ncbi:MULTISPECIES: hypothetical protein [unclassified Clostridium]|uniref:hypothetical protein n=1 Tax=Clostridium TaxID=1485 RepID=UPI001C8B214D|nr:MULTISPECIES: hypothetical protein [unclassified Clostridium]MBX9137492.1 hypothetical protein [Clostridium sp. K12(2020)]MBX9144302.1 hypothetical protein [Clostridium sp. K13]MDU2289580.1 hypothetical protein [Clostridium celatum]MDU4325837.1 hypothetical protein [Clostridium celatum]